MQVNVAAEFGGPDAEIKPAVQSLDEPVDGVVGRAIALLDEREIALDDFTLVVGDGGDPRIVQPQAIEGRADIGEELARMRAVQIADRSGEQHDVAQRISAAEDELLFSGVWMRLPAPRLSRGPVPARAQPVARGTAILRGGGRFAWDAKR